MATMGELSKRLCAPWEQSERVALLRDAGEPTETAIICRNDAVLSIELAFSALRSENKRLKKLVAKLDREAGDE